MLLIEPRQQVGLSIMSYHSSKPVSVANGDGLVGIVMGFALEVPVFGGLPWRIRSRRTRFTLDQFLDGLRKDAAGNQEEE
jgi:hypothetical protein